MKVRIKLTKVGPIRYVGHLDFMRFFQKALRKSGIACAFSGGFSPHLLISFASPLGVGLESVGEYVDVELAYRDPFEMARDDLEKLKAMGLHNDELPPVPPARELLACINRVCPEGVRALEMCRVEENRGKAMAMVRGADYLVFLEDGYLPEIVSSGKDAGILRPSGFQDDSMGESDGILRPCGPQNDIIEAFLAQENIVIHKVSKKTEGDADIRPLIYKMEVADKKTCAELLSGAVREGAGAEEAYGRAEIAIGIDGDEICRTLASEGFHRAIFLSVSAGSAANLKPETVLEAWCAFTGQVYDPLAVRIFRTEMYGPEGKRLGELGIQF